MADAWQPIYLSAKVFGHISQGLYRTPAGAIKELISNAFDADASLVRIHTDFPRFETFSCEDTGTGMSQEEFLRLMDGGIGSSVKRIEKTVTEINKRPLIGRLGIGILSLAQICTQFEIASHHKETKTAFRATIKFPPYTREEMDKLEKKKSGSGEEERIRGGEYQVVEEKYDSSKQGLRVFTKFLREQFRKRMRSSLRLLANKNSGTRPYKNFDGFLEAIYNPKKPTPSLNVLSEYDQLLFGLALAAPLPFAERHNVALNLPAVEKRHTQLKNFNFRVQVDNLSLTHPVFLPSDREEHTARQCRVTGSQRRQFDLVDGPAKEQCNIMQHTLVVAGSDVQFQLYEIQYSNNNVAGRPLAFGGYLFQQIGRLYPRDIQGVLMRLQNVAIGKYDNSMLTYPLAEGPRYSMISSEIYVQNGFEDALNIDRDSFNELHPHYIRAQSYVHSLLHDLIFPETWSEEKKRNKKRRDVAAKARDRSFVRDYRETTGEKVRSIKRIKKSQDRTPTKKESPVEFKARRGTIEINQDHPLLQPILRRRKYASLIEKLVVAFERANGESPAEKRRETFYRLLAQIFSDV